MATGLACLVPSPDGFGVDLAPTWPRVEGMGGYASNRGRTERMPYAYGDGGHPHARAVLVDDVRNFGQTYILGASGSNPETADAVVGWTSLLDAGPVRPAPVAITDSRMAPGQLLDGALSTQRRLQRLQWPGLELQATANLGLELFSTVTVTDPWVGLEGAAFRVVRLIETWNRGELKQHVFGVREGQD